MRIVSLIPLLHASFGLCASLPDTTIANPSVNLPLPAHTVAQLNSTPTWLENIAVRPNGDLLITQLAPHPILYTIKKPSSPNASLSPIYEWHVPNVTKLLGITETTPDTFVIVVGNATTDSLGYPGTFSLWEARFPSSSSLPSIRKITNIPAAMLLNGIVSLPAHPEIVLVADSQYGLLFRVDTKTGKYEIVADREEFKPRPELSNATVGFGINGVKIWEGGLYFSNSNLRKIFRVDITGEGYVAKKGKARVEMYADLNAVTFFVDDFTFKEDGTLWAVSNLGNSVVAVSRGGRRVEEVVGARDELVVAGGTAVAFGRTGADENVLYVSTAGAVGAPVNGTVTEPGKVVAVDTSGYAC